MINLNRRGSAEPRFGDYLKGLCRHDAMRAVDMVRALPERENDSELVAWFSDPVIQGYRKQMNV